MAIKCANSKHSEGRDTWQPDVVDPSKSDRQRNRRAGDGDRTRITSLEGWGSAIELRPRSRPRLIKFKGVPAHLPGVRSGRGGGTRTPGLLHPKQVRYHCATPRSR